MFRNTTFGGALALAIILAGLFFLLAWIFTCPGNDCRYQRGAPGHVFITFAPEGPSSDPQNVVR
jgi:hypothetical protein